MNTRSKQRKQKSTPSEIDTLNGSLTTPPDSPTDSVASTANDRRTTRQANGTPTPTKKTVAMVPPTSSSRRSAAIYRVPMHTWNLIVRKWEVPRKTLHVSIGSAHFSYISAEDGADGRIRLSVAL